MKVALKLISLSLLCITASPVTTSETLAFSFETLSHLQFNTSTHISQSYIDKIDDACKLLSTIPGTYLKTKGFVMLLIPTSKPQTYFKKLLY